MAKQYTIPFKSFDGKDCLINIYNTKYTGEAISLSTDNANAPAYPAATPIYIEEDDSESLLNVVRTKTGYITLIERTFGALQSLYPETNRQNAIELYYDGTLVFFGFMQAQAFQNEWAGAPRTLQFPIFSPSGTFGEQRMSNDASTADRMLGDYLDEVLSDFDYVVMPLDIFYTDDDSVVQPCQLRANNRIACPWNPDYNFGLQFMGETPSLYAPITYQEFLEGFCNLYGLMAHEVGKTVVFSRFGYTGQYIQMEVGNLQEDDYDTIGMPSGANLLTWEQVFDVSSTDNRESNVMPLGKLSFDYGDYDEDVQMDLSRCKSAGRVSLPDYEDEDLSNLAILAKQTGELSSSFYTTDGGTLSTTNHVRIVGTGSEEMVELRIASETARTHIFSYTFQSVPVNIAGATIETTMKHEDGEEAKKLAMTVQSGGKYYDANHDWVTTPYYFELELDEQGACKTYDVAPNGRTITLSFYTVNGTAKGIIKNITIQSFPDALRKYEVSTDTKRTVIGDQSSKESATVDMIYHSATTNDRRVSGGDAVMPTYAYLLLAQLRHQRTVKIKSNASVNLPLIYLYMIETSGYDGYWRVIATAFDPRNDEYRITLHRSSTLEPPD